MSFRYTFVKLHIDIVMVTTALHAHRNAMPRRILQDITEVLILEVRQVKEFLRCLSATAFATFTTKSTNLCDLNLHLFSFVVGLEHVHIVIGRIVSRHVALLVATYQEPADGEQKNNAGYVADTDDGPRNVISGGQAYQYD